MILNFQLVQIKFNKYYGNRQFILDAAKRFGSQCIVISIDAKKVGQEHRVFQMESNLTKYSQKNFQNC